MSIDRQFDGRDLPLTLTLSPQAGRGKVDIARLANQDPLSSNSTAWNGQSVTSGCHESPSPRMAGRRCRQADEGRFASLPARMRGIFFGRNQ